MSVRALLPADSLQEYEIARVERLYDSLTLAFGSRAFGSIYLLGYSAEMTLKLAYFRCFGYPPNHVITPRELRGALDRGRRLAVPYDHEGFHSLLFWTELLIRLRIDQGRPLGRRLESQLTKQSRRIHENWRIDLRYKRDPGCEASHRRAMNAAFWFERNAPRLWR